MFTYAHIRNNPNQYPTGFCELIEEAALARHQFVHTDSSETLLVEVQKQSQLLFAFVKKERLAMQPDEINQAVVDAMAPPPILSFDDYSNSGHVLCSDQELRNSVLNALVGSQIPLSAIAPPEGLTPRSMSDIVARLQMNKALVAMNVTTEYDRYNIPTISGVGFGSEEFGEHVKAKLDSYVKADHPAALQLLAWNRQRWSMSQMNEIIELSQSVTCDSDDILAAREQMEIKSEMHLMDKTIAGVIGRMAAEGDIPAQCWIGRALEIASPSEPEEQLVDIREDTQFVNRYRSAMDGIKH
jgi:hypothetical protein